MSEDKWDEVKEVFGMTDDDLAQAKRCYVDFQAFFNRALQSGWRREEAVKAYGKRIMG